MYLWYFKGHFLTFPVGEQDMWLVHAGILNYSSLRCHNTLVCEQTSNNVSPVFKHHVMRTQVTAERLIFLILAPYAHKHSTSRLCLFILEEQHTADHLE